MRKVCLIGCVLIAAACSGGHHGGAALTLQQRAAAACKTAAPRDFVNAQPTTVGDIHAIPGPVKRGSRAYSNVLSRLPAQAFAAWCWRQPSPHHYVSYVVGPHGEVVYVHASSDGEPPPRPGPEIPV
jgi:hypothetical protein